MDLDFAKDGLVIHLLIGFLAILVGTLIRRMEKGNELLTECAQNIAIISVKLEFMDNRIAENKSNIINIIGKLEEINGD